MVPTSFRYTGRGPELAGLRSKLSPSHSDEVNAPPSVFIVDVQTSIMPVTSRGAWLFVHVASSEGITGLGEASQSGNDTLVSQIIEGTLRSALLGHTVEEALATLDRARGDRWPRRSTVTPVDVALSGVEMAVLDLKARVLRVPLFELLGGKRVAEINLYANINRSTWDRSADGFARVAVEAVDAGFTAIKIAPFDEFDVLAPARDQRDAVNRAIHRIRAVRSGIGPDVELLVDCHCRLSPEAVRWALADLEGLKLGWFEEPFAYTRADAWRELKRSAHLTLAGGESMMSLDGFLDYMSKDLMDVVMPDVKYCGIENVRLVAKVGEVFGKTISPHNPSGPISTLASAHAAVGLENCSRLEYAWNEVPWRRAIVEPPEDVTDGHLRLTEAPGLGVTRVARLQ